MLFRSEAAKPGGSTDLAKGLEAIYQRAQRRGIVFILSDLLSADEAFWRNVDLFRKSRHDVRIFQIVHPEELDLPELDSARFIDPEGNGSFDAEPEAIRAEYRARFQAFLDETQSQCRARGCEWRLALTNENPCRFLRNSFLERGKE